MEATNMPKPNALPATGQLRSQLQYDPDSPSGLRWLERRKGRRRAYAGNRAPNGYWRACLEGENYQAHRLIWALVHGEDPGEMHIDHIDGDPGNNRIENLRLATHAQNLRNRGSNRDSTSRHSGVCWSARDRRWIAQITADYKHHRIGSFRCETAAALAYHKAAITMHGDFANTDFTKEG
jgi:hypothetical protein